MKRYSVIVPFIYDEFVEVEAENEDEAWKKIREMQNKDICGSSTIPVSKLYIDTDYLAPTICEVKE